MLATLVARSGTRFNSVTLELMSSACALIVIAVYLRAALRRTFGDGRAAATARALVLTAAPFFVTLKWSH